MKYFSFIITYKTKMLMIGETNIILTNTNQRFAFHNISLFPVVFKYMSSPKQKEKQKEKKHGL